MNSQINFSSKFKFANVFSIVMFLLSIIFILFKGLNYGIDFKGGTLIELRVDNQKMNITEIRSSLNSMNLGDINVKEFGKKGDYLIKIEEKQTREVNLYQKLKKYCLIT